MNFLGLGPGELLLVMMLALIVFGPQKLPEIGRGLGKAIGDFRRATSEITQEFNRELQLDSILNPSAEQSAPPETKQVAEPAVKSSSTAAAAAAEEQTTASTVEEPPASEAEDTKDKKQEGTSGEV